MEVIVGAMSTVRLADFDHQCLKKCMLMRKCAFHTKKYAFLRGHVCCHRLWAVRW